MSLIDGEERLRKGTSDSGCAPLLDCVVNITALGLNPDNILHVSASPFFADEQSHRVGQRISIYMTLLLSFSLWKKCCRKYPNAAVPHKSTMYKSVAKFCATGSLVLGTVHMALSSLPYTVHSSYCYIIQQNLFTVEFQGT